MRLLLLICLTLCSTSLYAKAFQISKPFVQTGHGSRIGKVILSADNKYVFSGDYHGVIKLWDVDNDKELKTFSGHSKKIIGLVLSHDNRFLYSSSEDNTIKIWDVKKGVLLHTLSVQKKKRKSEYDDFPKIGLSLDGKVLVSSSGNNSTYSLKFWDTKNGKLLMSFDRKYMEFTDLYFTKNGHHFFGMDTIGRVFTVDLQKKELKQIAKLKDVGKNGIVQSVFFTNDSKYAMVSVQNGFTLWDLMKQTRVYTVKNHHWQVIVSENEKYIITTGIKDGKVHVWDFKSGKELKALSANDSSAYAIFLSKDNQWLVSSNDHSVKLWNFESRKLHRDFKSEVNNVSLAQSDDKKLYFKPTDKQTLDIFETKSHKVLYSLKLKKDQFMADMSSNSKFLAVDNGENFIDVWDLLKPEKINTLETTYVLKRLAISPNGKYLVSHGYIPKSRKKYLTVWDIAKGDKLVELRLDRKIFDFSFSLDSKRIFAAVDSVVGIIDIKTRKMSGFKEEHHTEVKVIKLSSDGRELFSGDKLGTILRRDIKTGRVITRYQGHVGSISQLGFMLNGQILVSASSDSKIKIWDVSTGKLFNTLEGHVGNITGLVIDENNRKLITTSSAGETIEWKIRAGKLIWDFNDIKQLYKRVDFLDGEWITMTSEGYFDTSNNGAKHLNILTGPMEVSSIDQYYETFFVPI